MTPKQLKQLRAGLDLTQAGLAARLGISREHVTRMETGQKQITGRTEKQLKGLVNSHPVLPNPGK